MTISGETNASVNMVSSIISSMLDELSKNVTIQYILRIGTKPNEISIVLIGHLLVEYLMNRIIEIKCKGSRQIIEHPRDYPFSVKLQIIYSMGLLPDHILNNIAKIN